MFFFVKRLMMESVGCQFIPLPCWKKVLTHCTGTDTGTGTGTGGKNAKK